MPAASTPPARVSQFIGRVPPWDLQSLNVPVTLYPWAGNGGLGYIPVGYQNAPGYPGSLQDGSDITVESNTTYSFYTNLAVNTAGVGGSAIGTPLAAVENVTCIGCEFNQSGASAAAMLLYASNVTFRYCTFEPTGAYGGGVTPQNMTQAEGYQYGVVADGTPEDPGTYNTYCVPLTLDHCEIWGYANATKLAQSTQASPLLYDTCWVHDNRPNTDGLDHQDGIGCPGSGTGSYVTIRNCQVQAFADTQALAFQGGPWSEFTITGNLFGGYGYTLNVGGGGESSYVTFTGNTYSTFFQCQFGPIIDTTIATGTGSVWQGNRWLVPPGAYWGHGIYNGYYWVPGFTSEASPSLDELAAGLVSLTDY